MKTRNFSLFAIGLSAAITVGNAGTATAQAKSEKRIPVRKDAPPEAMPAKTDTVIRVVHDTITLPGRTETVTRTVTSPPVHDTVMQMLPTQHLPGLFLNLGAGVAVPMNHFRNSIHDGVDLNVGLGYFPHDAALGIRIDGNFANFAHRKTDCLNCPDTKLYAGMADLVLRFPIDRKSFFNPVIYFLGGGGIDKFSNFIPYVNTDGQIVSAGSETYIGNPPGLVTAATRGNSSIQYDYNAGVGFQFNVGGAHIFAESRYVSIATTNGQTHYAPFIAGLSFF